MKKRSEKFKITPWEVRGKIDYGKLIREFGINKIDNSLLERIKKHAKELHPMLRRKIFFANRDMKWILDEYEKGNNFFLYTGCGPSGPIHLGHLGTWIFTKWLQDKFNVELWFQFTDDEKFLFKDKSYEEIQKWTIENMKDVIALGFDPRKTHFLIDTKDASLLYPEAIKFAKKITFSSVKAAFGFNDSRNIGEIFYTSMQAVPAIIPSVLKKKNIPCLIPLAVDQDPHFRIARDVYPKLGYYKPSIIHSLFLPPLEGIEGKMSSSNEGVAILTTDSPKEVERKIKKYAFSGGRDTLEEHRKKGGNPDVDVSFQYLKYLFEPDDEKLKEIYDDYKSGKMTTGELKDYTIKKINSFLKEHQKKRAKITDGEIEKFFC
ncbi:tryptophan--tRNA ligase [Candidatus Pacearchaeota archaeon CG10_big_fil_rev_8_21_14_0_10_34_12]|nr:MAG: tryptophan--tRNA ligase [Candidatus Pacearchaeota archaeon CG10_big_fil_rev_8_21_14_0_10_34_12]